MTTSQTYLLLIVRDFLHLLQIPEKPELRAIHALQRSNHKALQQCNDRQRPAERESLTTLRDLVAEYETFLLTLPAIGWIQIV